MALLLFLGINELVKYLITLTNEKQVIQSAIVIDDVIKYRKSRAIVDNIKPVIKSNKKKNPISAAAKKLVWNMHIGEEIGKSKCLCCKSTYITQLSFHCGHIISEFNGGETIVSNLRPICQNCNSSMGTKNMNDFMKTLL